MSVHGLQKTTLGAIGTPTKPEGQQTLLLTLEIMIDLVFTEQVAGRLAPEFWKPLEIAMAGDEGVNVTVTVVDGYQHPVDLRAATSKNIIVRAPDQTVTINPASFVTNGADGKVFIALDSASIAELGFYFVQFEFTIGGQTKHTTTGKFKVKGNLA